MAQSLSKFTPIFQDCVEVVHPWTQHCYVSVYGCLISTLIDAFRIYSTVYVLALLSRRKIPKLSDLLKTFLGILRSTAFLGITSAGIIGLTCVLRNLFGRYYFHTVIGVPTFLASIVAILAERQSRRMLLSLYVSNVATETLWKMAVARNMVSPIKHGQAIIATISMTILLFYYKYGLHKMKENERCDSTFTAIKFLVGPHEEKKFTVDESLPSCSFNNNFDKPKSRGQNKSVYPLISQALEVYKQMISRVKTLGKNDTCSHPFGCFYYILQGACKTFGVGVGIQVALKLVLNLTKIFKSPKTAKKIFYKKDLLYLGVCLGGFSGLYRFMSCLLRRTSGTDSPYHAIPAGLVAGTAFTYFPDTTVALYVFWKMLQITYNLGIQKGVLPTIPWFTEFLYCLSTTILFHNAMMEPLTIRSSYWRFLYTISGGRMTIINRIPMDVWGLNSSRALEEVMRRNKIDSVVKFPFGLLSSHFKKV